MIRKRTTEEVRRYDIFKLSIVLLLLVLIFFMLLRDTNESTVATTEDDPASSEVDESTASGTTTEEAYPPSDAEVTEETDTIAEEAYPADSDEAVGEDDAGSASAEPVLMTPAQGAELEAGPNVFSGSAEPNSIVRILADGSELGQTTADANGNWYLEANLETGDPVIEIQTVDTDGNVIASAPTLSVAVAAAEVAVSKPDLVLNETNLYAGSVELNGTGEPGHQVAFFVAGEKAATVEVQEDGRWNLPLDLEAGTHRIGLQTLDENDNVVNEAGPFEIAIQEPVPPTVALPDDDVFAGGMTLTGTGQPGTAVQLYANETVIGEATVDENGNYAIEVNLTVGRYNIDVATLDKSGNALAIVPALSLPVLALVKPEFNMVDPEKPEFDPLTGFIDWRGTADPQANLVLVINGAEFSQTTAGANGNWIFQTDLEPGTYEVSLQQVDIEGNVVSESDPVAFEFDQLPPILQLPDYSNASSSGSEDEAQQSIQLPAGDFSWTGKSQPDESVAIIIDGEMAGTVATDADGNWIITTDLETGDHEVQIGTIDEDGNLTSQSAALDLNVADMSLPTMEVPQLDESGKGLVNGSAEPEAIVAVTANGKVAGITTANENGEWAVNVVLGTGLFDIQAQVLDKDGNIVLSSAKLSVEVAGTEETGEPDDVIDVAVARGEFSILLDGLADAGLTDRLSDSDESFTLFAPTDAAFAALPHEVIESWNANPEAYKEIMFYLILEGANTQEELAEAPVRTTLAGTNIGITTADDAVLINGVQIEATLPAGNSFVHAIDQVILPPLGYEAQPPVVDISGVSIFTGDYLTVVGTAEPGTTILLQIDGGNFGELAAVDDTGFWQTSDDIASGVHDILAYMLDENGLLVAISQQVSLPVQ